MNILFVTHRYPPHTGGIESHVGEIATRIVDRGHSVTVFSTDAAADVQTNYTEDGVRVRRFLAAKPGDSFYVAPQLVTAIRRLDVDIVHAHNYHAFPVFFSSLSVSEVPFIITTHYHGGSANAVRNLLLSLYRPFGQWALRKADDVIAVSEWEHDQLCEDFGIDATVIRNGIDLDRFANADPEQRATPYLLCVGRIEAYKGIQHAIWAVSELPEHELVIAGQGPYRETLERLAQKVGVSDRVTFLGFVDDDRLPGLYAGADAYVTLSSFEAYGMTVAEALASGTPCVVREAGALVDWAEREDCVGVSHLAPETIASRIRSAITREVDLATLQDWEHVVDRLLARYQEAIPHSKG